MGIEFRWPPAGFGSVLVDCGATTPPAARWILRTMAAVAVIGGVGWMSVGSPVMVFDVLLTLTLVTPMLVLSMPRHTLLCENGVAAVTGAARWGDVVTWESYDGGRRLSLVMRASGPFRVQELTIETRLSQNRAAAIALLRERVPNGRVLP